MTDAAVSSHDVALMQRALEQAVLAGTAHEVPVGALVALDGRVIAEAHNQTRARKDPTAHAEMVVLRRAASRLGVGRLVGTTLYVTLEPCAMCAGAIVLGRVQRLVFATPDPKAGMCGSLACIVQDPRLNHRTEVLSGVLQAESANLLRDFFRARR